MSSKKLDQIVLQMENYLECWKQFNHYLNIARSKQFGPDDEMQFLEVKSILTQELELIYASIVPSSPTKEDILSLIGGAPSIRSLSEMNESALRAMESQWHKIYIGWQSLLGQLKVQQREEGKSFWKGLFGKK
jgi:hypothetical protein